jgi:hypothetical protein
VFFTAASCFIPLNNTERLARYDVKSHDEVTYSIYKMTYHPNFLKNISRHLYDANLAIVELTESVPGSHDRLCIPPSNIQIFGIEGDVIEEDAPKTRYIHEKLVVDPLSCLNRHPQSGLLISERSFCVENENLTTGAGFVVKDESETYSLVGIGNGDVGSKEFHIFTNVPLFSKWIHSMIGELIQGSKYQIVIIFFYQKLAVSQSTRSL